MDRAPVSHASWPGFSINDFQVGFFQFWQLSTGKIEPDEVDDALKSAMGYDTRIRERFG